MLRFNSLGNYKVNNKQVFTVNNPKECDDFDWLNGQMVAIDNNNYKITGIEIYAHAPPWRKGEKIGLMVSPMRTVNFADTTTGRLNSPLWNW